MSTAVIAPPSGSSPVAAPRLDGARVVIFIAAGAFAIATSVVSAAHWAAFEYRTFDLAFYVQALSQFLHGHTDVSLLRVPLLGNHAEPIVFLIAPIFAVIRHPLVFVVAQNAMLATMGPVGYDIGRRLGLTAKQAALLAVALLAAPATCFVALHEFHPEALSAPLLLLMLRARLQGSVRRHWLWFLAVLACKENMALLLIAYCAVYLFLERKRGWAKLHSWYAWPLALAGVWFLIATKLLLPALNSGNVDYLALYDRLGASPGEIVRNFFTEPGRLTAALAQSLRHGNLLPALLLPFLGLPLGRPRWLLISTPVLLQHLLSWRSSEWMVYFHYGAPLLPLFWFAMAETVAMIGRGWPPLRPQWLGWICGAVVAACATAQLVIGPAPSAVTTLAQWPKGAALRQRQREMLSLIPPQASVIASLPYLSHLATRPQLYSLHHILKGLRTLSRATYEPPPPTDFVLIDYTDSATFDAASGYYHPMMNTSDGRIIPSSDRLLHDLLKQRTWISISSNRWTLLRQTAVPVPLAVMPLPLAEPVARFGAHTQLLTIGKDADELSPNSQVTVHLQWLFDGERDFFPWMELVCSPADGGQAIRLTRGLSAPEAQTGIFNETWRFTPFPNLPAGDYSVEVVFFDNAKRAWSQMSSRRPAPPLCPPLPLGRLAVKPHTLLPP